MLAILSEQQKSPSQAFLAGVKKLIDQVLLESYVPYQHMRQEAVGERMFSVKHANHLFLFDNEQSRRGDGDGHPHTNRLPRQASFAKEVAGAQNRHDRLFANLIYHGELHAAILNVQDRRSGITLRVDLL